MSDLDIALHRAVNDLAGLPTGEIEAVLASLPEAHARRIATMMAGTQGKTVPVAFDHLSSWLVRRIEQPGSMTEHAVQVLAQCARSTANGQKPPIPLPQPSLLSRFGALLRGEQP